MEAWKYADADLFANPVAALSATALRWGLDKFPVNTVAIEGYLANTNDTDIWPSQYAYPCEDDSGVSVLCYEDAPCHNSSCSILIEGINATTTGPAHSNIVGLTHGIICLLIHLITTTSLAIAGNMGCCFSSTAGSGPYPNRQAPPPAYSRPRYEPQPISTIERQRRPYHLPSEGTIARQPTTHLNNNLVVASSLEGDLTPHYTRPPNRKTDRAVEILCRQHRDPRREVERCTELLRQMFTLDLQAWGMGNIVHDADRGGRALKHQQADALFAEIRATIKDWQEGCAAFGWTHEEQKLLDDITCTVNAYDEKRYG